MALTVTIAEDDLLVREGIVSVLELSADIEVLDVCGDLDALLTSVDANRPEVVLTDIRMPPTQTDEGIRAARHIRDHHPGLGVVVLSNYDSAAYAIALLEGGSEGRGYLLKERVSDRDQLIAALVRVASGGSVIDSRVVDALVDRQRHDSAVGRLTSREREVLAEMARGMDNGTIAEALFISQRSVEKHIGSIFTKLGLSGARSVDKRVQAVLIFLEQAD